MLARQIHTYAEYAHTHTDRNIHVKHVIHRKYNHNYAQYTQSSTHLYASS